MIRKVVALLYIAISGALLWMLRNVVPRDVMPLLIIACFLIGSMAWLLFLTPTNRTKKHQSGAETDFDVNRTRREFLSFSSALAKSGTMEGVREKVDRSLAIVTNKTLRRT